ncbi:MAG: TM2 domain-containing protein [Clostridia bacterium]|nr:TM2 domain-containing protein [Clostridia bacterium]
MDEFNNDFQDANQTEPQYQQPQYQQPQYQQPQYQQPQYQQPAFGPQQGRLPSKSKEKIVAGLLGIFLGALGIHKFYLGYSKAGVIMLLVSLLTFGFGAGVMGIIGLIEGILYITKSDEEFDSIYVLGEKQWF